MNSSRIEETINEIYQYLEEAKTSKLYSSKVTVDKGELMELINKLKTQAPEELKRYQKVVSNKDEIIKKATKEAEIMLTNARQESDRLLAESELVQSAYIRADEIMNEATNQANALYARAQAESEAMRKEALNYANGLLADASKTIEACLKETENKERMYTSALKNYIQIISDNRKDIETQLDPEKFAKQEAERITEETNVENSTQEEKQPETIKKTDVLEDATGKTATPIKQAAEDFTVPEGAFLEKAKQ